MSLVKFLTIEGVKKKLESAIIAWNGTSTIVATAPDGFIDPSLIKDSEVLIREASESVSVGDAINIWDDTTAKGRKADASAFGTRCFGFARNAALVTEDITIVSEGIVTGFVGLTIGVPVFLDNSSPGGVVQVPPVAAGEIWQMLGEAVSATELRVEIGEAIVLT